MKRNILFLLLLINITNCTFFNKKKEVSYLKTNTKKLYRIDYDNYLHAHSDGKIIISSNKPPNTINPFLASNSSEKILKNAVFSTLFYLDPKNGLPTKNIVKDYYINNDSTQYTFTIRDDIKFSSGKKMLANDIINSLIFLKTNLNETDLYYNLNLNNEEIEIELISDYDFKIKFKSPNSNLLYALSEIPILQSSSIDDLTNDAENIFYLNKISKWKNLIGSGPFIISEINEEHAVLKRNPNYFKLDSEGKPFPYSELIEIKFYENRNREILAFNEKIIDLIQIDENDYKNLYKYYKKENFKSANFIESGTNQNKTLIAFNCFNKESKSYLKDIKLRKFLYDEIIQTLNNKTSNIDIESLDFIDSNKDGILENKNSETIYLKILVPEEEKELVEYAKLIKATFERLNFDVYLEIEPFHVFFEKLFIKYQYDIALFNYFFKPGVISYYKLLNNKDFSFYPFVSDNNTANYIENELNNILSINSLKEQKKEIIKIENKLRNIYQLLPVKIEKKYYLINPGIYNLKTNTTFEEQLNLITLERIIKKEKHNFK